MKQHCKRLLTGILAVALAVPSVSLSSFANVPAAHDEDAPAEVVKWLENEDWSGNYKTGWGSLGLGTSANKTTMIFEDFENNEEVHFDHGIGMHANCEITYDISHGKYAYFDSYIGLDKNSDSNYSGKGSVIYQIYLDDELAFTSDTVKRNSQFQHCLLYTSAEHLSALPLYLPTPASPEHTAFYW